MIRKIATKDLQVGMYVADVGRSWLNHPWATKSKLISNYGEIAQLLEYGIAEVNIDTLKSKVKPVDAVEEKPDPLMTSRGQAIQAKPAPKAPAQPTPEPVSAVEFELPRAAKAYNAALDTSKALVAACRMNKKIELEAVRENVEELVDSVSRNRDALMALMKLRHFDDYTYTHSLNVSVLAISTGKSLGLSDEELKILGLGTMFHDLGKSRVPGWILNKPGKLSDTEFAVMRDHAALSGQIIVEQKLQVDEIVYKIARHHHERTDGSGYPDHLTGDAIPGLVTVCALADVYDALTSDRVYHKGRSPHEALKLIYSLRGSHFPAEWVDRFVQSVGIYPPGTVIQLNTNQVAVVMSINQKHLNDPLIKIVADPAGVLYARPQLCDLTTERGSSGLKIKRVLPRDETGFEPASYFNPPRSNPS